MPATLRASESGVLEKPRLRLSGVKRSSITRATPAARYHQLLTYELAGLREVMATLQTTTGGRDLQECLTENRGEIERLEIEVAWCRKLLGPDTAPPPS